MPLDIPDSAAEVDARSKADVQRELQRSNPFLKNSWLGAIVTACANRIYDLYLQLLEAIRQNFPDTATGDYLIRWAAIWGRQLIAASKASGNAIATGTLGSTVPISTTFSVSGLGIYTSTAAASITAKTIQIQDLTRSGTTVTALCETEHGLANNVVGQITGATNTQYNISAPVTVISALEFTYEITTTPPDELGTGAQIDFNTAVVPIESDDFGAATNLAAGTELNLQSPIVGVDDTLTVDFGAIGGGTDQESQDAFRERTLDRIQNPVAHFSAADIRSKAKEVAGVTRVFVQEVTPTVGQVTIYFMRDNDADPIPDGSEVTTVKNKILEIKPANTIDDDVIVNAPTGVDVDFTYTGLTPNTATMRAAITANLQQFFEERTEVGVNIDEDAFRSAIFNTVDTQTGDLVETFTLSAPAGDVTIAAGEIGVLGTVTYP